MNTIRFSLSSGIRINRSQLNINVLISAFENEFSGIIYDLEGGKIFSKQYLALNLSEYVLQKF